MGEVAGVVVANPNGQRMASQGAVLQTGDRLARVSNLGGKLTRPSGPVGIVPQQVTVGFQRGSTTCGVDDDFLHVAPVERCNHLARTGTSLFLAARVQGQGTAAALGGRRNDTASGSGKHPRRCFVDVSEEDALNTPGD